jgi:hypothetical protein
VLRLPSSNQGWTKKAERIKCSAPLPENPADPLLMRMLVPAPYQVPEKKDKKKKGKEAESGLRHKGTSDAMFGGTEVPSSHEGDEDEEEEEEESNSPHRGRKKRRAASVDSGGGGVQKGEGIPLGWLGFGCRSHPQASPQGGYQEHGGAIPMESDDGGPDKSAPSRTLFQRPMWLRNRASNPLQMRGERPLRRRPPLIRRRQTL